MMTRRDRPTPQEKDIWILLVLYLGSERDGESWDTPAATCDGPLNIEFTTSDCTGLIEGQVCDIVCDDDTYVAEPQNTVECLSTGEWESGVTCEPTECGPIYDIEGSDSFGDCSGTRIGNDCLVFCERSLTAVPGEAISCLDGAVWEPDHECACCQQIEVGGFNQTQSQECTNRCCEISVHGFDHVVEFNVTCPNAYVSYRMSGFDHVNTLNCNGCELDRSTSGSGTLTFNSNVEMSSTECVTYEKSRCS